MAQEQATARVPAVHRSSSHSFSKFAQEAVILVPGLGVRGDAHSGATVKHRSRVARDPSQPNLRQVHLLQAELFGLRNPCTQLDRFQHGLMGALLARDAAGRLVRKAGVMGVVRAAGEVQAGDAIRVDFPAGPERPLEPV